MSDRRQEWISEFTNQLAKHKQSNTMEMDLESLPHHCVVESNGRIVMTLAGLTTLVSQVRGHSIKTACVFVMLGFHCALYFWL